MLEEETIGENGEERQSAKKREVAVLVPPSSLSLSLSPGGEHGCTVVSCCANIGGGR